MVQLLLQRTFAVDSGIRLVDLMLLFYFFLFQVNNFVIFHGFFSRQHGESLIQISSYTHLKLSDPIQSVLNREISDFRVMKIYCNSCWLCGLGMLKADTQYICRALDWEKLDYIAIL